MQQKQTGTEKVAQPKERAFPSSAPVVERQEPARERAPQATAEIAERGASVASPSAQAQQSVVSSATEVSLSQPSVRSQRLQEVEGILSDGLQDLYWSLTPPEQQVFRTKGEHVARSIDTLLDQTKLHIAKVISLIKEWLRSIPHVNRFFLEQEAKIKADKIRAMHDKR